MLDRVHGLLRGKGQPAAALNAALALVGRLAAAAAASGAGALLLESPAALERRRGGGGGGGGDAMDEDGQQEEGEEGGEEPILHSIAAVGAGGSWAWMPAARVAAWLLLCLGGRFGCVLRHMTKPRGRVGHAHAQITDLVLERLATIDTAAVRVLPLAHLPALPCAPLHRAAPRRACAALHALPRATR